MVKKINLFFLLIGCLLFASFSPSLDGRAVVADPGTLPEGYFAKTVGYLPGDSIMVSNLASQKTLDILVVGSLDQSEGVAILLSPEAAAELGIVKDSNVIVKITKRSGELDEAVSGTAVIAQGETSLSSGMEPKPAVEDAREEIADENTVEDNTEQADANETDNEESGDKTDVDELISEAEDDTERAEADLESAESELDKAEDDIATAEAISDERVSEEPVVTEAGDGESERIAEETAAHEDAAADESEAVPETIAATEEEVLPDEKIIAEDVPEDVRETSEAVAEDIPAESADDESRVTDEPVVTEAETDETPAAVEDAALAESAPPAEAADEKIAADIPPEEVQEIAGDTLPESDEAQGVEKGREEELIAESVESAPPSDGASYQAIVLTPEDGSEVKTESTANAVAETRAAENVRAESVVESAAIAAESTVPVPSPRDAGGVSTAASLAREYGARTAENLSSLDKGTYYVQIASLSNPSNIRETLGKYGRDYPVTLVPLASKASTQIMIGPLSVDEYAVVLERFKSYGYKDAFVRKIR
ncbi:SPOR domain-containing protein [Treponema sp. Marseille-Q4130]|uniref:SPOR domain-containing protein n=1 Tax=Treponema sp. Marseille-Q4130 TaxID=2766702 RepID=UPI001651CAC9|nr:SPOR domain-containing protein [Treponema sp. Marseille-Q4130]MBC6720024.1 hypothetical protein [Treponema sp. Marseille-Q4130]